MFQDSIRLLVHPNKETILDIIQSVTFKGAICLYTLAWVILRIIMGNPVLMFFIFYQFLIIS